MKQANVSTCGDGVTLDNAVCNVTAWVACVNTCNGLVCDRKTLKCLILLKNE